MILQTLTKHPETTAIPYALSLLFDLMDYLSPFLSFLTIIFYAIIAYLTIHIKVLEYRKKKKENNEK